MSPNKRSGFTLVELLTVVVIIGVLVGLLVPAVQSARESARQAECMNRLHELAVATQGYVAAKQYYPGFQSKRKTTWAIELMPHFGRNDLWTGSGGNGWRTYDGNATSPTEGPKVFIETLTCPNDPRNETAAQLSFTANSKVFNNHNDSSVTPVTPEYVNQHGGQSQVVMIGERSATTTEDRTRVWWNSSWADAAAVQTDVAFIWDSTLKLGGFLGSGHPSIVQVIFCDGHGEKYRTAKPANDTTFSALP